MRKPSILNFITNTSVAVGLGAVSLFGGIAHAGTFSERVQAELNTGKDYSAAVAEASRATGPLYAYDRGNVNPVQSALNQGKDYVAGWDGSRGIQPVYSPEQLAKAQKAEDEMNEGKDYSAAWAAPISEQPAPRAQAARKAVGSERTSSTK